jgi:hypothetical protein
MGGGAGHLKCVRENWIVPPGLASFSHFSQRFKRWAKLGRPSGAGLPFHETPEASQFSSPPLEQTVYYEARVCSHVHLAIGHEQIRKMGGRRG